MAKKLSGVRLEDGQREALATIAARNKCDVSDLIRWAVDALIAHVERSGGRLLLPVDFSETFEVVQKAETKLLKEPARKAG